MVSAQMTKAANKRIVILLFIGTLNNGHGLEGLGRFLARMERFAL